MAAPRANVLNRRPGLRVGLLLLPPMLWLGVAYLVALGALFVTSLWGQNAFTGTIERVWTLDNFRDLFTIEVYRTITLRTLGIAALVTIVDAVLAFPIALYMAKVASPRLQRLMVIAVLMPLWASYLVKVYAWRAMLQPESGVLAWFLDPIGLNSPGYGYLGIVITLTYLWLPYMILPIYAGLTRLPDSMLDASADLGAKSGRTFRSVVMPIIFPSIVAGSVFTFSLSLGDYITAQIVGGKVTMLGNVVQTTYVTNLPFAAAVATIPVVIVLLYLLAVRRSGALNSL